MAARLRQARRRRFVGRSSEIELFASALAAPGESFTVLFVHGPGGAGKTALLNELTATAEDAGVAPVRVDARTVPPSPAGLLAALGVAGGESAATSFPGRGLLLLDTYELFACLDDWLRERFLPDLPADTLVVIAGRHPPTRWLADPGWRDLLRVVSLRNLPPVDTRAYLRVEGVPEELHEQLVTLTHGHPLTLSMLVDAVGRAQGPAAVPRGLVDAPDIVRALLARVVDEVPSTRHRQALEVCAHTRFTTEELIRDVLGGADSHELFGWLRTLSFVEEGTYGVHPHDVTRDILDADFRWRDGAGYADLHRRLRRHLIRQARADRRAGPSRIADVIFLSRIHPVMSTFHDMAATSRAYIEELRPADAGALRALTARLQGAEQAEFASYWMDRQPSGFRLFRDVSGELIGFGAFLTLDEHTERDCRADPGASAAWEYAQRHGPPRPGEQIILWRFLVDTEAGTRPSRSETLIRIPFGQETVTRSDTAWTFLAVDTGRDYWEPLFSYYDFHRAPEAAFQIGGQPYDVYAHDWRRRGVEDWLDLTADRELGAPVAPSAGPETDLVLSEPEFAAAVRAALRDLRDSHRLGTNPLLRSRLVRDVTDGKAATEVLRDLIGRAAATLRDNPREADLHHVIDRTFLRPAPTQERAAEMLGLPFSTFRRHRDRGVQHIIRWLWQREVHGH